MDRLLKTLESRFRAHPQRHAGMAWNDVRRRLESMPDRLGILEQMEASGGEPDVIGRDATGAYIFCDCAPESPKGRRSLCYDPQAWESRREHKPVASAVGMAAAMGVRLLNEAEYRHLQTLGEFDTKTSSWLLTPPDIRDRGGSVFGDRRYDAVFIYHNGAESYYASRGWRGILLV